MSIDLNLNQNIFNTGSGIASMVPEHLLVYEGKLDYGSIINAIMSNYDNPPDLHYNKSFIKDKPSIVYDLYSTSNNGILRSVQCLSFDGVGDSGNLGLPSKYSLEGTTERVMMVWVKTSVSTGGTLLSFGEDTIGKRYSLRRDGGSSNLRLEWKGGGYNSSMTFHDGEWHLVAVSQSGGNVNTAILHVDNGNDFGYLGSLTSPTSTCWDGLLHRPIILSGEGVATAFRNNVAWIIANPSATTREIAEELGVTLGTELVADYNSIFRNTAGDNFIINHAQEIDSELATGTCTNGTSYLITATEVNHFGTGLIVNDIFISNGTETLDTNNKVKETQAAEITGATPTFAESTGFQLANNPHNLYGDKKDGSAVPEGCVEGYDALGNVLPTDKTKWYFNELEDINDKGNTLESVAGLMSNYISIYLKDNVLISNSSNEIFLSLGRLNYDGFYITSSKRIILNTGTGYEIITYTTGEEVKFFTFDNVAFEIRLYGANGLLETLDYSSFGAYTLNSSRDFDIANNIYGNVSTEISFSEVKVWSSLGRVLTHGEVGKQLGLPTIIVDGSLYLIQDDISIPAFVDTNEDGIADDYTAIDEASGEGNYYVILGEQIIESTFGFIGISTANLTVENGKSYGIKINGVTDGNFLISPDDDASFTPISADVNTFYLIEATGDTDINILVPAETQLEINNIKNKKVIT